MEPNVFINRGWQWKGECNVRKRGEEEKENGKERSKLFLKRTHSNLFNRHERGVRSMKVHPVSLCDNTS